MRRLAALLVILFACGSAIAEDALLTKAFIVKFRKVDEVASVINGLLSDRGAVTLQPRLQTLVVQDYEKNLRQVEMAIAAFDTPPPGVEISVKLVLASRNPHETPISEEIKNIARLGEVLRYNQYTLLDSGLVRSEEGKPTTLTLAQDYQLSFTADVIEERNGIIRMKDFQLRKRKKEAGGKESYSSLLSLTLNLHNEETLVLGASRFEDSKQALMVVLRGKIQGR